MPSDDNAVLEPSTAVLLARYNAWADQTLFDAVASLPSEIIYKPSPTLFGSMIATLNHNYQVDLIWRAHLLREKHGFTSRRSLLHPKIENLIVAQVSTNRWLCEWASAQTPQTLHEEVAFRYISGEHSVMEAGAIFLHLINHKTYHRGWVSEMFFAERCKPPETDLCVFVNAGALP